MTMPSTAPLREMLDGLRSRLESEREMLVTIQRRDNWFIFDGRDHKLEFIESLRKSIALLERLVPQSEASLARCLAEGWR